MIRSRALFAAIVFLASFLLFMVEPIAAKQLLPTFGGSAAVWITCLVFFQTALLCAYLYAHWLTLRPNSRSRTTAHLALLLLAVSIALLWRITSGSQEANSHVAAFMSTAHPVLGIFMLLTLSIGLPFLMLGATSPLLQVWLAQFSGSGIPFRLYALSNLASLLALGLYPTVIEPNLTLRVQWSGWFLGFALFTILSMLLAWRTRSAVTLEGKHDEREPQVQPRASGSRKMLWILLPMGASMQLSAVTNHLTQNIAAIPLLWILPLAVYLISIILAFQFPRLLPRWITTRLLVILLAGLGYMLSHTEGSLPLKVNLIFFLLELFVASLFCHSEAFALRPKRASETTLFYLLFAAGGALGAFLIGIASPLIFSYNYDLAISFFMTALLAVAVVWSAGWEQRLLWSITSILMLILIFFLRTAFTRDTQVAVRNFYGSLRVKQSIGYPPALVRTLSNGTIQHGSQIFSPELLRTPTTYYAEDSGVGLALRYCCQGRPRKIGVIGLGVGTVAAYGKAGDQITFYEINPAVIPIARNVFAYIKDSPATINIVEGDARTSLSAQTPQQYDLIVIDAFSGDAIPLHLLTAEAIQLYKRNLVPGGILAFHISNQHVDLEPEIAQLAKSADMQASRVSSVTNDQLGEFSSTWVLVSSSPMFFRQPQIASVARQAPINAKVPLWTDDYSSLLPILHW